MVRTLALAAGLAISASAAQAAFTGVAYVEGDSAAASTAIGSAATVIQIFAVADGPGDGLFNTAVSTSFVNITPVSGTFFQSAFGTDLPPNAAFFPLAPDLMFDTFGTVGAADNSGDGAAISEEPGSAMDTTSIVGGFFNSNPPNNIGAATDMGDGTFGTLLFQITVLGGGSGATVGPLEAMLNGEFTLFSFDPDNPQVPAELHVNINVPTPGSLALFGIAGLAATRRRRA